MSTSTSSIAKAPEPQQPLIDESQRVAPGSEAVHDAIRDLLADEYPDLATQHGGQVHHEQYLEVNHKTFIRYLKFIYKTLAGVASSFVRLLSFQISLYRFWELLVFSTLISIVLTIGVLVCVLAKVPFIHHMFVRYLNTWHDGVYITNIINNKMFGQLTPDETEAARLALAASESSEHKEFNLDIAKLLLLFASIMYERTSSTTREAIKDAVLRQDMRLNPHRPELARATGFTVPGDLIRDVFGRVGLTDINQRLERSKTVGRIQQFTRQMEIEFEPISELSSMSSAYCALFWDAKSNWIVVAFKGTSPTEFDEWITDFDITRVPAQDDLPGYGNFHRGFKERIFPEKSTSSRSPYETILRGVDIVSKDLIERLERKGESVEINVYFTGHSLGCATSTLAYVKMIDEVDLDHRVHIRDAYLFAAPVVCDMKSVKVFNQRMARNPDRPKTMWRIVNGNDVVASGLPSLGDKPTFKYPDIIFAFAHLGMEIKMRRKPTMSTVSDYYTTMTSGAAVQSTPRVSVASTMNAALLGVIPEGENLPLWKRMLQHLPIVGRMFAHFPGYYWQALQLMGTGDAQWVLQ